MSAKLACEGGFHKKCGTSGYGVHRFSIELRGVAQGEKALCGGCRSTFETSGYTLTQLADVPEARNVKTASVTQASSPTAWQSWIDKD